jgi:sugar phosphate isomerase/epimerase
MRLKFALFSGSAPTWTPAELASRLAAQGWDGVEWRVADQQPSEQPQFFAGNLATFPQTNISDHVAEIASVTRGAGLGQPALFTAAALGDEPTLVRMLEAASAAGTGMVRVAVPKTAAGLRYDEQFGETRRHAQAAVRHARRIGVKPLIQIHHGNIVSSPSSARRLLEGLDPQWIGAIHDLGNMSVEGREGLGSYTSGMEILGPYMAHVHVKNVVWRPSPPQADGTVDWSWSWAPLATGFGDVKGYFRSLHAVGYSGWVTAENFTTEQPLEERIAGDLAYLATAATEAGYAV